MLSHSLPLLAVLASPFLSTPTAEQPAIHARMGRIELNSWPRTIPEPVRVRAEWALPFAAAIEGRIDIEQEGRVLLVTTADRSDRARRRSTWVRRTVQLFDETLPWIAPTSEPDEAKLDVLSWRYQQCAERPIVLIGCEEAERGEVMALLRDRGCFPEHTDRFGFDDTEQFVGVWVEEPEGTSRWNDGNAIVHHLSRALLAERFGHMPEWFCEGFATWMEQQVCGSCTAMAHRPEDLDRTIADGFEREIKERYQRYGDRPFDFEGMTTFDGTTFDEALLADCVGLISFLAEKTDQGLAPFCAELGMRCDAAECTVGPDGGVQRSSDFTCSPGVQAECLTAIFGPNVFHECSRALRKGHRYRRFHELVPSNTRPEGGA